MVTPSQKPLNTEGVVSPLQTDSQKADETLSVRGRTASLSSNASVDKGSTESRTSGLKFRHRIANFFSNLNLCSRVSQFFKSHFAKKAKEEKALNARGERAQKASETMFVSIQLRQMNSKTGHSLEPQPTVVTAVLLQSSEQIDPEAEDLAHKLATPDRQSSQSSLGLTTEAQNYTPHSVNGGVKAEVISCGGNNLITNGRTLINGKNEGLMRSELFDTKSKGTDWIRELRKTNQDRLEAYKSSKENPVADQEKATVGKEENAIADQEKATAGKEANTIVDQEKATVAKESLKENAVSDPVKAAAGKEKVEKAAPPLRATSIQLNSFVGETNHINNQRKVIAELNKVSSDQIAHIITPSNGWYTWANRLGRFGRWMFGENKAKRYNLPGWATYAVWMSEDFGKLKDVPIAIQKEIDAYKTAVGDLETLKNELNKELASNKPNSSKIEKLEGAIKAHLSALRESLIKIEQSCKDNPQFSEIYQKSALFQKILASQLNIPGGVLERDQEHMMIVLLNMMMNMNNDENMTEKGVNTAVNCYSGSDRTGDLHAKATSIQQLKASGYSNSELFNFVQNWTSLTTEMNKNDAELVKFNKELKLDEYGEKMDKLEQQMKKIVGRKFSKDGDLKKYQRMKMEVDDLEKKYNAAFPKWKERYDSQMSDPKFTMVRKFRSFTTNNDIHIGLVMTYKIFKKFMGLKWQKGIALNRVPLNSLDPYVFYKDSRGNDRVAKIVEYTSDGKVSDLSQKGHNLLTKFQNLRSAYVKHDKK